MCSGLRALAAPVCDGGGVEVADPGVVSDTPVSQGADLHMLSTPRIRSNTGWVCFVVCLVALMVPPLFEDSRGNALVIPVQLGPM